MRRLLILPAILFIFAACKKNMTGEIEELLIDSVLVNDIRTGNGSVVQNVDYLDLRITVFFDSKADTARFTGEDISLTGPGTVEWSYRFSEDSRELQIIPDAPLAPLSAYDFIIRAGTNPGAVAEGFSITIHSRYNPDPKFPVIPDDSLLTLVQRKTFSYFWDYAHPVSGLARERSGSGDLVTSGGSGFGLMAILTGIERGFITRAEGFERIRKIVSFLNDPGTERFHGVFPHWLNGSTGKVIPFSQKDNGADLVETSYLMQGLLTALEYFKTGSQPELSLCDTIRKLWESVDYNWFRRDGQNRLFWHWSPQYGWEMNLPVRGWNEALIVYVLAAASPGNAIPGIVYDEGWARNGAFPMTNGKSFYGIELPLGEDYGGPLFFAHYSFLGLDPRNLSDRYASYMQQNTAHAMINYEYCKDNPRNRTGYSNVCWGLTASDIPGGYTASSPLNDRGVIAPTAAISSLPYTPEESMDALRFFYYILGDRIWGEYGFRDAFSLDALWFANSYLAIDQGPVICMIENFRSALLWTLFMSNVDVRNGLDRLGFTY